MKIYYYSFHFFLLSCFQRFIRINHCNNCPIPDSEHQRTRIVFLQIILKLCSSVFRLKASYFAIRKYNHLNTTYWCVPHQNLCPTKQVFFFNFQAFIISHKLSSQFFSYILFINIYLVYKYINNLCFIVIIYFFQYFYLFSKHKQCHAFIMTLITRITINVQLCDIPHFFVKVFLKPWISHKSITLFFKSCFT